MPIDPNNLSATAIQTFGDEFDSLSLFNGTDGRWDTNYWWGQPNGTTLTTNNELEWYIDATYAPTASVRPWTVQNGILNLTASPAAPEIQPAINGYQYTSGMVTTYHSFTQTYGYFEMRAELPAGQGLWPAFWLLPADGSWPPELDVMEALGHAMTELHTTVHSQVSGSTKIDDTHYQTGQTTTVADMSAGFHTYGVDWQPDTITWYFDGQQVFQTATPADMDRPMYMLANLAVGGIWPGNPDATTQFPATMQIDYIRAYQARPVTVPFGGLDTAVHFAELLSAAPTRTIQAKNGRGATLAGTSGPDILVSGNGKDTMSGGLGDDTYVVNDAGDVVLDGANAGIDTVQTALGSYTLPTNVENLVLTGSASQQAGIGNNLDNVIQANGYSVVLTGGGGRDSFVFARAMIQGDSQITDFTSGLDQVDLHALRGAYTGSDPVGDGVLKLVDGATGLAIQLRGADGSYHTQVTLQAVHAVRAGDIWF